MTTKCDLRKVLLVCLCAGVTGAALGAVRSWDGGGADAHWSTAPNWIGDIVPVSGDEVVVDDNSPRNVAEVDASFVPAKVRLLSIGNGMTLRQSKNLTRISQRAVKGVHLQRVQVPPGKGSLQPVAIGAAVEATKPSKPLV